MKIDPASLSKAVDHSFTKYNHFRRARAAMMAQMVGRFYRSDRSGGTPEKASPINLIYQGASTLIPNLVFNDPRAKVTTDLVQYRDYAELLALAVDHTVRKIKLRDTLRACIMDAIFMAGFVKTGLAVGSEVLQFEGQQIPIGRPYIERIDPDDMILDPMARTWEEQAFVGNRYRVDADHVAEMGIMDPDALMKLASRYEQGGVVAVEKLSGDQSGSYTDIARYVDLVDLYLPREGLVCTIPYQTGQSADKFLAQSEYVGPDSGPYHMLAFTPVSDNLLPVAPAMIWHDLHVLGNQIARKLARQAEAAKRVLAYQGEAVDDAERIAEAEDGEAIKVEDVDKVKEVNYGGATEDSYKWMAWVKGAFSEQAGSIELLQGTNTNAPTATQAEMLNANASVRVGDMQNTVYYFAGDAMDDVKFWLHTDPLIELPLARRVNGTETQAVFSPDSRVGEWQDYHLRTKPYSMTRADPAMMVRRRLEFATNVIPAAAQAFAMLGPGFKVGPFLHRMATEVGLEDADEWLDDQAFQSWVIQQAMANTGDPGKAGQYTTPPPGVNMPPLGGVNPNPGQPAPSMRGPQGGISPSTEQAAAQQETAGAAQASTKALAMQRGS
jgi:hypothetical protein